MKKETRKQTNSKISDGMKRFHEERKLQEQKALEIEKSLGQKIAAISSFKDVSRYQFTNLSPQQIAGVLTSTQSGYFLIWSDFCDYILETDAYLKGLVNIRNSTIKKSKLKIQPADSSEQAKQVADFVRKCLDNIPEFDIRLRQLNYGLFTGCSVQEILYERNEKGYFGIKEIVPISLKKIKIRLNPVNSNGEDYETNVTTGYGRFIYSYWNDGDNQYGEGIDMHGMFPGKFIIHSPGEEIMLHYKGLFRSIAWEWFMKQVGKGFYASGCESYAFPVIYAKVPQATPLETRQQLAGNLSNLKNDATTVVDEYVEIDTISPGATGGSNVWQTFIESKDSAMTTAILGGNLMVNAGANGSYALGKVQQDTMYNLVESDATALAETIKFQLIKPLLEFNQHLFGDVVPDLPIVFFDVEVPREIPQMALDAGVVSNNELRKSIGLTQWAKEQGGDEIAKISIEAADPLMAIANGNMFENASTAYASVKKKPPMSDTEIAEISDSATIIPEEGEE